MLRKILWLGRRRSIGDIVNLILVAYFSPQLAKYCGRG
jgi:hypothetical protein